MVNIFGFICSPGHSYILSSLDCFGFVGVYVCLCVCLSVCVGGQVCSFGFVSICLILHLPFVLGSLFVSCFGLLVLITFIAITNGLRYLGSLVID